MDNGAMMGDVECTQCASTPNFASNTTCGVLDAFGNVAVQYNDTSIVNGDPTASWYWDFAGQTKTTQNPVINYTSPGVYGVDFGITNGEGTLWKNVSGYYTVRSYGDTCIGNGQVYSTDKKQTGWFTGWF
jgi:PKD repeat protein